MLGLSKNNSADESDYVRKLNSVKSLQTPPAARYAFRWLTGIFVVFFIVLLLPWQQNIHGTGKITALSPADRPQTVQSAIAGRIIDWRAAEGQAVKKGDTVALLSEIKDKFFDPRLSERITSGLRAKRAATVAKNNKISAYDLQIEIQIEALELKLQQSAQKIRQKELKVLSDSATLEAKKIAFGIAKRQNEGAKVLFDSGYISKNKTENMNNKSSKAEAELTGYINKFASAKNELQIARADLRLKRAEAQTKIAKLQAERSSSDADLQTSLTELIKSESDSANVSIRQSYYAITAPLDGRLVKAMKSGLGANIKAGDAVFSIMPHHPRLAVELLVKASDVPLIDPGRHVRLRFDGWPAIQFSGWPGASVGTFGGKVRVVDLIDSKPGKYRVVVSPDPIENDEEWPERLRQGSGVHGQIMLDNVPLFYEIWRQLNGFPPSIEPYEDAPKGGDSKKKSVKNKL